jgi:hypothetical protein
MSFVHEALTERITWSGDRGAPAAPAGFSLLLEAVPSFVSSSCAMSGVFYTKAQRIHRTRPIRKCENYARFSSAMGKAPPEPALGQRSASWLEIARFLV